MFDELNDKIPHAEIFKACEGLSIGSLMVLILYLMSFSNKVLMKWLTIYINYSILFLKKVIFQVNGPMFFLFRYMQRGV